MRSYATTYDAPWGNSYSSSSSAYETFSESGFTPVSSDSTATSAATSTGTSYVSGTSSATYTASNSLYYDSYQDSPTGQTITYSTTSDYTSSAGTSFGSTDFTAYTAYTEYYTTLSWSSFSASTGIYITSASLATTSSSAYSSYSQVQIGFTSEATYSANPFPSTMSSTTYSGTLTQSTSGSDTFSITSTTDAWTYTTTSAATTTASGTSSSTYSSTVVISYVNSDGGTGRSTSEVFNTTEDNGLTGSGESFTRSTVSGNYSSYASSSWSGGASGYVFSGSNSYSYTESYSGSTSTHDTSSWNRSSTQSGRTTQYSFTSRAVDTYGFAQGTTNGTEGTHNTAGNNGSTTTYSVSNSYTTLYTTTSTRTVSFSVSSVSYGITLTAETATTVSGNSYYTSGSGTGTDGTTYQSTTATTSLTSTSTTSNHSSFSAYTSSSYNNFVPKSLATVYARGAGERLFSMTGSPASSTYLLSQVLSEGDEFTYTPATVIGGVSSDIGASSASGSTVYAFTHNNVTESTPGFSSSGPTTVDSPYFGGYHLGTTSVSYGEGVFDITSQLLSAGGIATDRSTMSPSFTTTYSDRNMRVHARAHVSIGDTATVSFVVTATKARGLFSYNTVSLASP